MVSGFLPPRGEAVRRSRSSFPRKVHFFRLFYQIPLRKTSLPASADLGRCRPNKGFASLVRLTGLPGPMRRCRERRGMAGSKVLPSLPTATGRKDIRPLKRGALEGPPRSESAVLEPFPRGRDPARPRTGRSLSPRLPRAVARRRLRGTARSAEARPSGHGQPTGTARPPIVEGDRRTGRVETSVPRRAFSPEGRESRRFLRLCPGSGVPSGGGAFVGGDRWVRGRGPLSCR